MTIKDPNYSRRDFLRGAGCMLAAGGVSSFVPKLNVMGEALAQSATSGYKALVCVYLGGGNDSWNLLIPTATNATGQYSHAEYVNARNGLYGVVAGGLAIPRVTTAGALPAALPLTASGGSLGVNPFAPEIAALYNSNRLAFVANVGTVVEPLTRATYNVRKKPPQLYSHNDQTTLWQIGTGSTTFTPKGFGGDIAGLTATSNLVGLPPALSVAGQNRFLIGETLGNQPITPFQLSTSSSTPIPVLGNYSASSSTLGEPQRRNALDQLLNLAYPELFSKEHKDIFNRSLSLATIVNAQFAGNPAPSALTTTFPATGIGNQLKQVARLIKISRPTVNGNAGPIQANRQVFYVNVGGYDTHDGQILSATQALGHHQLLAELSAAVNAFNNAMNEIGSQNEVTLFTMSDFARTINSNGNGTDHSWGSVQFVMGGAVTGGQTFGRYPRMVLDLAGDANGECFSRGQFLPTTAVDQLGATMARWMGVDDSNLPLLFPNIDNFASGPFANAGASPTFANFNRVIPNLITGLT